MARKKGTLTAKQGPGQSSMMTTSNLASDRGVLEDVASGCRRSETSATSLCQLWAAAAAASMEVEDKMPLPVAMPLTKPLQAQPQSFRASMEVKIWVPLPMAMPMTQTKSFRASMEVRWTKSTWLKGKIEGDIIAETTKATLAAVPIARRMLQESASLSALLLVVPALGPALAANLMASELRGHPPDAESRRRLRGAGAAGAAAPSRSGGWVGVGANIAEWPHMS